MEKKKCASCGKLTDELFLRIVKVGTWPFKKKVKICLYCIAAKEEGLI